MHISKFITEWYTLAIKTEAENVLKEYNLYQGKNNKIAKSYFKCNETKAIQNEKIWI